MSVFFHFHSLSDMKIAVKDFSEKISYSSLHEPEQRCKECNIDYVDILSNEFLQDTIDDIDKNTCRIYENNRQNSEYIMTIYVK